MRLNQVSAESWPLEEACFFVGIPIEDDIPVLCPADDQYSKVTQLQPWQPTAIAWMLWQLDTTLRRRIPADAYGLNKTLSSLCLVYYAV
jgi:hypothetical protein